MLWIVLDRSSHRPLTTQVYEQIRDKILQRELQAGERLPSTRKCAQDLGVSRNVLLSAYDQLISEGYLESREGSGTYVADGTSLDQYTSYARVVSQEKSVYRELRRDETTIDFVSGTPDLSRFPRKIWANLLRNACLDTVESRLNYGPPEGLQSVRVALSKFLLRAKGIHCHPEQIIVLSGSAQGFLIIGQLFGTAPRRVMLEDPSYRGIQRILQGLQFELLPVPVDAKGMQVEEIALDWQANFLIVTPSHQFPMGSVFPIQRRVKLIEYARRAKTCIVENDYDSEFRYTGAPISSLHVLAPDAVIHIGTFSESLYPAVRLGYMIVPDALIDPCRRLIRASGLGASSMKQLALAEFLDEGHWVRHLNRMKKCYREKRELLIAELTGAFHESVKIHGDSTGLYLVGEFHELDSLPDWVEELEHEGVRIYPVENHAIRQGRHPKKVILGYGNLRPDEISRGVAIMKRTYCKMLAV